MYKWIFFICLHSTILFGQENEINQVLFDKMAKQDLSGIRTMKELAINISELTKNKREQLQALLIWNYRYMQADSVRFLNKGRSLSVAECLTRRVGLCEEFTNIVYDYCNILNIPCFKIEGYVRTINFIMDDSFKDCNHAWNAVYIDSSWYICDLFGRLVR